MVVWRCGQGARGVGRCEGRGEVMASADKCGCGLVGSPFTTVFDALAACGPATPAFHAFVRRELWAPCEHCEGEGEECDGETLTSKVAGNVRPPPCVLRLASSALRPH